MGFWSFVGHALNSVTADVPHARGVVTTGCGDWGIYCGSHRILTVMKDQWGEFGRFEIGIIPDTVFLKYVIGGQRHYYHFINSEYQRYCISETKASEAMQRRGERYGCGGHSAKFVAELCGLSYPEEIEKAGFKRSAVFPEKF